MQSKRDQVQAHAFVMGRLTSGMLLADPDAPESPLSRTTRGAVTGLVIAVLISAGAVVLGLISPRGDDSWRKPGTLVVNRETGARYLYLDGRLRPVRNYASALLVGGRKLATEDVATASLVGTPLGAPAGIPGAPDAVPVAKNLDTGAWQVCAAATGSRPSTVLTAGSPAPGTGLGGGQAIVVSGPDGTRHLVWQGSRLRLDQATGAALSLGYGSVAAHPVSAAFLDALATGPALAAPAVPGRGTPGPALGGRPSTVGQVFRVAVPGTTDQPYYLLGKEGLAPLTATGAALVLGDPATRTAYAGGAPAATTLGADVLAQHLAPGAEGRPPATPGLPTSPPAALPVPAGSALCARITPGSGGPQVTAELVRVQGLALAAPPSGDSTAPACLKVDAILVRPGHGVLARALGADGRPVGDTTYLVADSGVKFRVPDQAALTALGYGEGSAGAVPSRLLAMLPSGPDLDTSAARGLRPPTTTGPDCGFSSGG
ncbi:type VII secretion protein EccB [Streptomyces sp. NPDC058579]|uniref:type VII secretion protein EccB n=1 Tax=Streptomyces sp. NPDC058579 TaxID=3346548 RepID=UPI003655EF09